MNEEQVDHPKHYNQYPIEVIDMMVKLFGPEAVYNFCLLNAFKYRMRAGNKPGVDPKIDFEKESWYLKMAEVYKEPETIKGKGTVQ